MAESKIRISAENRTKQAFDEIKRSIRDVEGASGALRTALAGASAGLSIAGIGAFVKSGIDAADELGKLSQKVGVTVESLSALGYAAKLSDVSMEQLSTGLRQLAKNATEAQTGTGEAAETFKALGISVTGAGGQLKTTEQLLLEVAEQFSEIEDGAGKTALAMRIFGKAGAELIPLLNGGRAGFEELRKEAERLGIIISTETAKAAEQFNDNLTRLGTSIDKLKIGLANSLLPTLNQFVEQLLEGQRIAGGFGEALRLFATINPFRDIGTNIGEINRQLEILEKNRARNQARGLGTAGLDAEIADQKKRLEFLKTMQRQEALALGGTDTPGERARMAGNAAPGKRTAPKVGDGKDPNQGFNNAVKGLEQEALKVQELTRYEEVLAEIQLGRYDKLTQRQRDELLALAAKVDLAREDARVQKEADQAVDRVNQKGADDARREQERLNQLADKYRDLIDPIQKYRDQIEEIRELERLGYLTPEQATEAMFRLQNMIEDMQRLRDETKQTNETARELGLTMASALGRVITEGGKARDVVRALLQDMAQILARKYVLEPISAGLGKAFGGLFGGSTGGGGVDLPDYDGGGYTGFGARSGGLDGKGGFLAMLHPNETVVDHARGGSAGGLTIIQNIQIDSRSDRASILQAMTQAKEQAKAEILDSQNRNGAFARN